MRVCSGRSRARALSAVESKLSIDTAYPQVSIVFVKQLLRLRMDALLLDAPVGGWAGGWGTLSELMDSSPGQRTAAEDETGEASASPQAATHLLRLSEGFVASDSPKVSPCPQAQKANRKAIRGKVAPLGDSSPAQLNRRLKLGTVSRNELERERKPCNYGEVEPTNEKRQGAPSSPESQLRQQDEENHDTREQQDSRQSAQPMQTPSPPSLHVQDYTRTKESRDLQRPGTAGSIREFTIPIDSTPWATDSAELALETAGEEHFDDQPSGGQQRRSRGRAAPRTPSASSGAPEFVLNGCTPPENRASPSVPSPSDSESNDGSAKKPRRRSASASRSSELARPSSRSSTLQSPAALASAAVDSALSRLEAVQRPKSREAVAVAREVRSEMNRWLRNVAQPRVPHQQLQAIARSRGPAVQSLDCGPLSAPTQPAGWVPYEQRSETVDQQLRSLTPSAYPSLSAARARQREQRVAAFGDALGSKPRTTRSAQSDARHSVSLPDIRARRGQVSQAAAEFQRKASRAIAVHDRPEWGRAQDAKPKKAVPGRPRRAAAPWAGLSAVPTVGAVMSAMR